MDKLKSKPLRVELTPQEKKRWEDTLTSGIIAQKLIGDGIAVGGTASSLYAGHRLSFDTDHLLMDLKGQFGVDHNSGGRLIASVFYPLLM